jgi:hypothetical protein
VLRPESQPQQLAVPAKSKRKTRPVRAAALRPAPAV